MKPMLAARVEDVNDLRFPLIASAKLDGVRAIVRGGCVLSRNFKPIPNQWVQQQFGHLEYHDGELIVGSPTAKDVYRTTVSGVMSEAGKPTVFFFAFDHFQEPNMPWIKRQEQIAVVHEHEWMWVKTAAHLQEVETQFLKEGYEGIMLRDPGGRYKYGRSTMNEHGLMKLKRFMDDEAVVIGFEEQMHNANEAKTNALGHTERSSHKENKIPKGTLGALVCQWRGITFNIGTGFDDATRELIWSARDTYLGKQVKFKYLEIGMKDAPRHPVFIGFRQGD